VQSYDPTVSHFDLATGPLEHAARVDALASRSLHEAPIRAGGVVPATGRGTIEVVVLVSSDERRSMEVR
jgi:hypothetical protein